MFLSIGMLKLNYFLADIFILSAEKQPIKLSWRKIECLLYGFPTSEENPPTVREGKLVFVWQNTFCRTKTQLALFV